MPDTNTIILCPGQGAQAVGMGKGWHDASADAKTTFEEANDTLGFDLAKLCFEGPSDDLNRTDNAQCAIYTASVACYRALQANGTVDRIT
ncbi:MAG: ACP S-malonyltransferase, partial [Phycisphaerales bacterium JB063]